jgi:hypothetical protein
MKNKKPKAEQVCKQIEDFVVPRLRLSPIDRAVYFHLLRHSRFEGKVRAAFPFLGSPEAPASATLPFAGRYGGLLRGESCGWWNAGIRVTWSRCAFPRRFEPPVLGEWPGAL